MNDQDLLKIAHRAADDARQAGAQDARAKASRSREVKVEWRDGQLDRIRESTRLSLSMALYVDGRYSANSTSDLRPDSVSDWVKASVTATRYLASDEHRHLPDPARYADMHDEKAMQIHDASVQSVGADARLEAARDIEQGSLAGDGAGEIVSVTSSVSDYSYSSLCVCTNGLEASERGTYFDRSAYVSVKDTDDRKPSGYAYGSTRFASDLPGAQRIGAEATRRAAAQIGSRQAPTGEYDLVIENRTVGRLFGHLATPLAGAAVQQKRSFLAQKLDQKVFSELLTITDEPHLPRGLSSTAWDAEGMATLPRPVIEAGVLRTFYLDTYYASKLAMEPTTGSMTNLVWKTGKRDLDAMVASLQKGILVESFLGGNSNATTGDFSMGIKGFLVEDGQIVHPVSEMNIAGNHLDFWNRLVEVGSDPWLHSSNRSPTLLFEKIQCSGA
jgi:PmbA protein